MARTSDFSLWKTTDDCLHAEWLISGIQFQTLKVACQAFAATQSRFPGTHYPTVNT